ncbi:MAG: hypothetical protein ABSG70_01595 [Terriglobales bacterium]|jgi:hypothetical protein
MKNREVGMRTLIRASLAIALTVCPQFLHCQTASNQALAKSTVVTLTTAAAPAKPATESPSHLVLTKTISLDAVTTTFMGEPKCDSDGSFYLRNADRGLTISKFNSKGETVATFKANSSPDVPQVDGAGMFTVDPYGNVNQLVIPHSYDRDVFFYSKDGSYKSNVKLDVGGPWSPSLFVTLSAGNFMATGQKWDRTAKEYVPFTGIFSSDGTLLKELHLEDDEYIHESAARGDSRFVPGPISGGLNYAISRGKMELGEDGNVYLLRWVDPAIIYAISPGGEIQKRFTVDPGDQDFTVGGMLVSGSRIAVLFHKQEGNAKGVEQQLIRIVDLDGNKVASYETTKAVGITLACYSRNPEQFTFLGWTKDERPVLNITEPQ